MATTSIDRDILTIQVEGLDKVWSLKSELSIPLAHIRGVTADPDAVGKPEGWKAPGTYLPGVSTTGTFRHHGKLVFWDVQDSTKAVVIELDDDRYERLAIRSTTRVPPSS